jgi:hypothetical protein
MFDFSKKQQGEGSTRTKTDFPVGITDNVILRSLEINKYILGVQFNYQRVEGDTISFLSSTLIPSRKEDFKEDKKILDKVITPEQQYNAAIRSYAKYLRHLLNAAGVTDDQLATIEANDDLQEYLTTFCAKVNVFLESKREPVYLRTVVNKKGYTTLPTYMGNGVSSPMSMEEPNFTNSEYENSLIEQFSKTGVEEEEVPSGTKQSGLDF